MAYGCKIIADSISTAGARITTMQLRFPRFLLAQFNTYRAFSRNARSSRAVPIERLIDEIEQDPVMPLFWGKNRRGMQAGEEVHQIAIEQSRWQWLKARDEAVDRARTLMGIGVHKQVVNRILEPFMWADVVVTATSFDNAFSQRCHEETQPETQKIFVMMARALGDSDPKIVYGGHWHLPYISSDDLNAWTCLDDYLKVSVARCARVSYRPHGGKVNSVEKDVKLHDKLMKDSHWSPFEHQARCLEHPKARSGNFVGWEQYRQMLPIGMHAEFDYSSLDRFGEQGFIVPK